MKYFRMSYEEVVFNRSFINIILLNRSIPSFNVEKGDEDNNGHGKKGNAQRQKPMHVSEFFMQFM